MIIGIDLGTTNSLLAVWESDESKVIPNALGKLLTPSVISIDGDNILIGEPALHRMISYPDLTVSNFKRYMGSDKIFNLGKFSFRAEELSALILKQLKNDAENYLGVPVTEAIISVPAYFSDAQRKATKIAGKLAGLKVERLINEPTAAGIAYGIQEQSDETNYLIFDLGGGTFDVSILSIFSGIIEVRASNGDNLLGGIDFTNVLENMFIEEITKQYKIDEKKLTSAIRNKIYEQAELAKHKLSIETETVITMKINIGSDTLECKCSTKDFEKAVIPLLQRLQTPVKKVLNDAGLSSSQIQKVILVGGASRMDVVKKFVAKMFGKFPHCYINPDIVVAQGTAIQSGLKAKNETLDEIVVTDVCPYSLGVEVCNSQGVLSFDPIIERNTTIPVSRSRVYYPVVANQTKVNIKIYQGENFYTQKNVFLGSLEIDLPNFLKNPAIDVRFTYDINGLLEVESTLIETKEKKSIVIEGNPGVLTEQQIAEKISEFKNLKIHPRESTENLLLLSQAERLFEYMQGSKRVYLSQLINEYIKTLDDQDPIKIMKIKAQFEKELIILQNELDLI